MVVSVTRRSSGSGPPGQCGNLSSQMTMAMRMGMLQQGAQLAAPCRQPALPCTPGLQPRSMA